MQTAALYTVHCTTPSLLHNFKVLQGTCNHSLKNYGFQFGMQFSLPSALAQGFELRIYSQKVCMYIRNGSRSGMSCGMSLHTCALPRAIGIGHMCVTQSDTFRYLDMLDSDRSRMMAFFGDGDGGRGWWRGGAIAVWILQTPNSFYSKHNTCHMHLTCTCIWHTHIVCTLAWGKSVYAYS